MTLHLHRVYIWMAQGRVGIEDLLMMLPAFGLRCA
jgi:hypothetical protein